jgi:putative beta-lysine N-acetyltransferase
MMMKFKSVLSHDSESNRVYLMHLHPDDFPGIIPELESLVKLHKYTKLFAKVPSRFAPAFLDAGYCIEASIPRFFKGVEDVFFLVKYYDENRRLPEPGLLQDLQQLMLMPRNTSLPTLAEDFRLRQLESIDAPAMVEVFNEVFESYPFPIFETGFLIKSMLDDGTRYYGIFDKDKLVAVSSAECDDVEANAEMTDFAVLPGYRGKRFAVHLLHFMEQELKKADFHTVYTISRLHSLSMNKTFYNRGYSYSGTLLKNTQIAGKIESMNVWYKQLS